jgi:hypothetical protein
MCVPTVFISYGREDQSAARRIYTELQFEGVDAWLDVERLRPGDHWKDATLAALRKSDYVILLLSSRVAARRGFLNTEIREALRVVNEMPRNRPFLLPARLDDCDTSHLELQELNHVDLFANWSDGMRRILAVVRPATPLAGRSGPSSTSVVAFIRLRAAVGHDPRPMFSRITNPKVNWNVYFAFGEWDFVVFCEAPDIRELEQFATELTALEGVVDIRSIVGLPIEPPISSSTP